MFVCVCVISVCMKAYVLCVCVGGSEVMASSEFPGCSVTLSCQYNLTI